MIDDIIDAVMKCLRRIFPECAVYAGQIKQGRTGPCFFVEMDQIREKPMTGARYFRENKIAVAYLLPEEGSEALGPGPGTVAEGMLDGLELIQLADSSLLRGTQRFCRVEGGFVKLEVYYNQYIMKSKEKEAGMESLIFEPSVKKEGELNEFR